MPPRSSHHRTRGQAAHHLADQIAGSHINRRDRGQVIAQSANSDPRAGADNVALLLQGRLMAGDVIAAAGLSAQPKAAKP
jgi:hypothetical protein